MTVRHLQILCGGLTLGTLLLCGSIVRAQEQVAPPTPENNTPTQTQSPMDQPPPLPSQEAQMPMNGVQPLASGPVHEAFAEPSVRGPVPTPVIPRQPPAAIQEVPPDQRPADETAIWIPGYWAWATDTQDFIWVSGIWRVPPPGFQWVPGYWAQAEGGWQWVPGFWQANTVTEVNYLPEPPNPVNEAVTPAPDNSSFYVPGTWVWQTTRYMWRPGFWQAYQPGWVWEPSSYFWTPSGYVFVDGYWDRPFHRRGLLFAPVMIEQSALSQANWTYTPSYVVSDDYLVGALFVQPTNMSYYFGDYFGNRYRDRGFIPWIDYRIGRNVLSPLLAYYSWEHRDNRNWYRDLDALYVGRQQGLIPAPPHTFAQQTTVLNQIRNDVTVNNVTFNRNTLIQNSTALVTLNQANRTTQLTRVSPQQLQTIRTNATQLQQVARQRNTMERQLGAPSQTSTQRARMARLNLPKQPMGTRTAQTVQPPARPQHPRLQVATPQATQPADRTNVRTQPGIRDPRTPTQRPERTTGQTRPTTPVPGQPRTVTTPRTGATEHAEPRQPVTRPQTRPQPMPERRQPMPQPERRPMPEQRQPRPQPMPERPQPRPQPVPQQQPRPVPQQQQHLAPQPRPQPVPQQQPRPVPQQQPRPVPQQQQHPAPQPRPQPVPQQQPHPAPQPRPEPPHVQTPPRPAPQPHPAPRPPQRDDHHK